MSPRRQLAAIMFTDIEGYTSFMQRDESAAVAMRNKHRNVFERITNQYSGKILQYYGDGTLSIFDSAMEAVQCGIDLQKAFLAASIPVRIGIHLGDIVFDKDDIIGDGVNIASRIESLAQAGSVLISGKVYDEIKNKQDIVAQKLGEYELKNVTVITPVYALANSGLVVPEQTGDAAKGTLVAHPSAGWINRYWWIGFVPLLIAAVFYFMNRPGEGPVEIGNKSIAVLPFLNMSNDQEQEYFSDGITEDILSQLSTIEDLKVISRTTSWAYKGSTQPLPEIGKELGVDHILEGSVRRADNQIRVVAQLIAVSTDEHLWAKTYDREITEVFAIQSEIAKDIANVLKAKLSPAFSKKDTNAIGESRITAYDYYLRGHKIIREWSTQQDLDNAIELLRQALIEEPDYAEAYADLALAYLLKGFYGVNKKQWVDSALILANLAIDFNPQFSYGYLARAEIYDSDLINDPEAAQQDLLKAYELDPNNSDGLLSVGLYYFNSGTFEKGIDLIIKSLEVEPDKTNLRRYIVWAQIYEFIDSIDQAVAYYQQAIKLKPDAAHVLEDLVNILNNNHRYQEAIGYAERIVKIEATLQDQDNLAWTYLRSGDLQAAYDAWSQMSILEQDYQPYARIPYKHRLAYVLWKQGKHSEAEKLFLEEMDRLERVIQSGQQTEFKGEFYDLAGINAFLGKREVALKWLKRAAKEGFFEPELMLRDPLFDGIRDENQYLELLQESQAEEEQKKRKMDPGREIIRQRILDLESGSLPAIG